LRKNDLSRAVNANNGHIRRLIIPSTDWRRALLGGMFRRRSALTFSLDVVIRAQVLTGSNMVHLRRGGHITA
jgi:hypothetical protein